MGYTMFGGGAELAREDRNYPQLILAGAWAYVYVTFRKRAVGIAARKLEESKVDGKDIRPLC